MAKASTLATLADLFVHDNNGHRVVSGKVKTNQTRTRLTTLHRLARQKLVTYDESLGGAHGQRSRW